MGIKKTIIGATAVVSIIAPIIPEKININLNIPITVSQTKEKPYEVVTTTCKLTNTLMDEKGKQICEYSCTGGDHRIIHKVTFNSGAMCQSDIKEKVRKTKK